MGIKEEFTGTSLLGKIAFILLLVANFCNWIAFCTTEWGKRYINNNNDDIYAGYGIWRICGNQEVTSGCSRTDGWALSECVSYLGFPDF
ncbi:hypothetical protein SNE40_010380 [Patella caerulea]|uniref:Claudin n=1 Tax=Patella caerulea TaxID=87958 RepID=A0AAN8JUC0_PATCE